MNVLAPKTKRFIATAFALVFTTSVVVALKNMDSAMAQQASTTSGTPTNSATPPPPKTPAKAVADLHDTSATMAGKVHAPKVFFISPKDGATVSSPVKLQFGVDGYQVKPAGVADALTGHHHVIIDGKPTAKNEVIPADETHLHFGKGQTEADINLSPGSHTLTLQFADGAHRSYGPEMSSTIHITVK